MNKKITVVTGAGRGIGEEIGLKFLKNGHFVYFIIHKKSQKKLLKKKIVQNKNFEIIQGDLTKISFLKKINKKINYCDNLINNAASTNKKFFTKVTNKDFNDLININLKSVFMLSQIFSKKMIKKKISGNIINLSSQLGHIGAYNRTLYCVTKFGIEGLTKSMALDLSKYKIKVNSISPTKTITNEKEKLTQKKRLNLIKNKIPIKEFPTVTEIANMIFFLCENSKTITGSSIKIDGGWTAGK